LRIFIFQIHKGMNIKKFKVHWFLESLIFWLLFLVLYITADDLLTTKRNGILSFLSYLFYWMPLFFIVIFSFYVKYRLSCKSVIINIVILHILPFLYFLYCICISPKMFLRSLGDDFPLEGDWLIYIVYLILTLIFSITRSYSDRPR